MATLIAVYNSEGCVGRCDARCYNAKGGTCDCICGGVNHGAGVNQAMANTREMAESWIKAYTAAKGLTAYTTKINPKVTESVQLTLL